MAEELKDLELSPEEQTAEEEALAEVESDELREELIAKLGIDPEANKDLLDRLEERELEHRQKLSGAIKQKVKWREKAQSTLPKKPANTSQEGKTQRQEVPQAEVVQQLVREALEQRDLETLSLAEELKEEVKDLAKLKGISIREAARLPYIVARQQELERKAKIEEATPKRGGGRGSYSPTVDVSKPLNPADFDMSTPEGAQKWKEARSARDAYLAKKQR